MFYKLEIKDHVRVPPELFSLKRKGYANNKKCIECKYRKEMEKFKDSLTFRVFSRFWDTRIEKLFKKLKL